MKLFNVNYDVVASVKKKPKKSQTLVKMPKCHV